MPVEKLAWKTGKHIFFAQSKSNYQHNQPFDILPFSLQFNLFCMRNTTHQNIQSHLKSSENAIDFIESTSINLSPNELFTQSF